MNTDTVTRRFTALAALTAEDQALLRALCARPVVYGPRTVIREEGGLRPFLYFLLDGWALSSITLDDGTRQILKAHVPGDVMGAPSAPFLQAVDSLTTITSCSVTAVTRSSLADTFALSPRLAWLFFLAAQEERVALMDRLAAAGRLGAHRSLALLLLQLHDRIHPDARSSAGMLDMPLTQQHLADLLGLTAVHVNRVLRDLRDEGLLRRVGRRYQFPDLERLRAFAALPARQLAPPIP